MRRALHRLHVLATAAWISGCAGAAPVVHVPPAPPAAPGPESPIARLAPVAQIAEAGDVVLAGGTFFALSMDRRSVTLLRDDLGGIAGRWQIADFVDASVEDAIFLATPSSLLAIETGSYAGRDAAVQPLAGMPMRPSWRAVLARGTPRSGGQRHIEEVLQDRSDLVVHVPSIDPYGTELVGLDAASGQERWRVFEPRSAYGTGGLTAAGGWLVGWQNLNSIPFLSVREMATGKVPWEEDFSPGSVTIQRVIGDRRRIVVVFSTVGFASGPKTQTTLRMVDPATGAKGAEARLPEGDAVAGLALDGDDLYVAATTPGQQAYVTALRASTLRERWHTGRFETRMLTDPVVARDAVLVAFGDGTLRAFDLASGWPRWSWGVGMPHAPWVVHRADGTDALVVETATPTQGRVTLFAPVDEAPPAETATIEGIVQGPRGVIAEERVNVGGTVVVTDASGRYRAVVAARGIVRVEAMYTGPVPPTWQEMSRVFTDGIERSRHEGNFTLVELDGRAGVYTADIRLRRHCPEGCPE